MTRIQKCMAAFVLLAVAGCNNKVSQPDFSTVDSNVAGTPDSIPPTLHLDSHRVDTSFPVAMDSAGPTIEPKDTVYSNSR